MKQLFLTLMLTCIYIGAKAQQSLSYAYDAAGNRTNRTIVLGTRASIAMEERKDSLFFEEMLAEKQLKIYPNPVEQQLNIAVDEYSASLDGFFELYDTNGKQLKKAKMLEYLRWGASPYHLEKIGNPTLRKLNQSIRNKKIPFNNWRTADSGHLHFKW